MKTLDDALSFARGSVDTAIDQVADYPSLDAAFTSHRINLAGTLEEYGLQRYAPAALAVFDVLALEHSEAIGVMEAEARFEAAAESYHAAVEDELRERPNRDLHGYAGLRHKGAVRRLDARLAALHRARAILRAAKNAAN